MSEAFVNVVRAVTRPIISVIFAAVIAQVVIEHITAPEWFLALASACILWWFGSETARQVSSQKENKDV